MHGLNRVLTAIFFVAAGFGPPAAAQQDGLGAAIELVDPKILRVCADPNNLPFSNEKGEGFENRLAELIARKLGKSLAYTYFPMTIGFVRNTLGAHRCDVIMGYPQGDELVQNTNPYYRTVYTLIYKPDHGLDGVKTLADPRLRDKKIGIIAGTPPATNMVINGLMAKAKPYPLQIDTRFTSSAAQMISDLHAGEIDAGALWGPMAGYYAKVSKEPIVVVPLLHEQRGSRMVFRITMGVRASDQEWKRKLNGLIRDNQKEINALLLEFGVPLLDEHDRPVTQ
ncbi:quinoprotein dehydrogenase-associated putative ABC transporter substrate-binding protein [Nordella sp. HKS 07]|uniref:substrate-binding domain-containing protein n=1 Tax=Nordella sp. HKS 07 TaxID=2712222 RepID=UPI0013E2012F|nr:substrate-binding domain-containing protein [Nordella sp. HKS 07]QIG48407.1 quinoprotein dehydrogenase-associated putative ABC transporter substrate-binding protein [Nordella sp. HKS 07]